MNNKILLLVLMAITFLTSSCLKTGYLKYEGKQNEIIASPKIKEFMKNHPNPAIVLKVPNTEKQSTQSDPNNYIYSAIEKELMIGGFNVKDRGLYNEVVSKADAIDYNELKKLTGTDLILELVRVDRSIQYVTNNIYTEKHQERLYENSKLTRIGAAIEFKITIIENNDYGGSYSFYYTPCPEGYDEDCRCQIGYKKFPNKVYQYINMCDVENDNKKFEAIETDIIEEFIRNGVKQMITEIRK